jgi:tetratricopeptide (TPR) repeat protein
MVAATRADSLNPWPHYDLGRYYERRKKFNEAIHHYGMAINKLTPRTATGPMLSLGVLHHRFKRLEPAERCYREVLATVPSDTEYYASNRDYQLAILGLKALLTGRDGAGAELETLRARFTEDCRGTDAQWETGATWLGPP